MTKKSPWTLEIRVNKHVAPDLWLIMQTGQAWKIETDSLEMSRNFWDQMERVMKEANKILANKLNQGEDHEIQT